LTRQPRRTITLIESVMDQFSAHLDRGWDLVQRGDSRGAELSARRALEIDSQSPEAYNLLGYVAALQGDFDDAIEHYRQAIALDDTYLEAMLNAAEVYIHPLGEFDEAIEMCDHALDLAETDDEIVDALLLKFDALLGQGEFDQAKLRIAFRPAVREHEPQLPGRPRALRGRDLDRAAPLIEDAVRANPTNPEAFYPWDSSATSAAMSRSGSVPARARLDLELPAPPGRSRATFELTASVRSPSSTRSCAPSCARMSSRRRHAGRGGRGRRRRSEALVLLDAVSGGNGGPTARVFVYQRNVERLAGSLELVQAKSPRSSAELNASFIDAAGEPRDHRSTERARISARELDPRQRLGVHFRGLEQRVEQVLAEARQLTQGRNPRALQLRSFALRGILRLEVRHERRQRFVAGLDGMLDFPTLTLGHHARDHLPELAPPRSSRAARRGSTAS
jgi:tetratricopeptide (TPR) repeat protein